MLRRPGTLVGTLAVIVIACSGAVLVNASSVRRAGAICSGSSPVLVSRYDAGGTLVAQEYVTYPGTTCDGNGTYSGAVLDPHTDGSCASAYYLEPLAYYALQGQSCTTGAWSVYSYTDTIGSNSVFVSVRPSYLSDQWMSSSGY